MITSFKTLLSRKKQLAKDIFLFRFQLLEPKEIDFKAGQYLILKINDQSRLYSIASPNFQKDSFELLMEIIEGGLGSTYLSNLKIGDQAVFQGPAGVFTLKESPRPKIFLATGTGLAPIRSMIKSILNFKFKIPNLYLFWGLKTYQDTYLFEELKQLSNESMDKFTFKICLSQEKNLELIGNEDREYFAPGRIQNSLESVIFGNNQLKSEENLANFDYYLCGSRQVVESLRQYLEEKKVPKEQIFFEKF